MYTPRHFAETRLDVLHQTIRDNPFATLVTHGAGGLAATHLPFLLDADRGEFGSSRPHGACQPPMARLRRRGGDGRFRRPPRLHLPILVRIRTRRPHLETTSPSTPTATRFCLLTRPRRSALLSDQVSHFESPFDQPWSAATLPPDLLDPLVKAIVAFEIPITRLEGKAKMSQNRPQEPGSRRRQT